MYKIRTLDDYVSSASGVPVQRFNFSYRLNTVSDGETYLYPERVNVCTWPEVVIAGSGIVGYPQASSSVAFSSLQAMENENPGVGGGYQHFAVSWFDLWGSGEEGLWSMSTVNARYDNSAGQDPRALLHSFTAFGAVGTVYLVDMLAVVPLGGSYAGSTLSLHPQDVEEIYARPALRGSTNVHVAYAQDFGMAWLQGIESIPDVVDMRFRPLDDSLATPTIAEIVSGPGAYPGAPWAGSVPTVESADVRALKAEGRIPALCAITPYTSVAAGTMLVFDVIASVDLTSTSVAITTGLSDGRVEHVAPNSNLGILFHSAVQTANPTLLQGSVKLLA